MDAHDISMLLAHGLHGHELGVIEKNNNILWLLQLT